MARANPQSVIPVERIAARIYLIRGESVMLDSDLAELYGVSTKRLNEQVSRNLDRFPNDFMFQLTPAEFANLKSQIATSSWGGRRTRPRAFSEHGVAMLSAVLRSRQAVAVSLAIVRTFVKLRRLLLTNEELARKVERHDREIGILFEHIQGLLSPPERPKKHLIGFRPTEAPDRQE